MALRAERRHDWEKRLTEEQEEKLISAIAAYKKSGHDLDLYHEGGKLDVYEPPMTASLYALTDAFLKGTDVAAFFEGSTGVLKFSREPNASTLIRHIETVLESARADVNGLEHSTTDEMRGSLELGVKAGSGAMNLVTIDLASVGEEVKKEREANERAPLGELVRNALKARIARDTDGVLWMRAPTADERSVARRVIDR
jgi:hypothetical protein